MKNFFTFWSITFPSNILTSSSFFFCGEDMKRSWKSYHMLVPDLDLDSSIQLIFPSMTLFCVQWKDSGQEDPMMAYSDYDKYHNTTNISKLIMEYLYCICIPWREIPKTFQYLTGRCCCKLRKEKNDIYIWISIVIMMYDDNTWQGLYDILGGHSLQSVSQGTATELHDMTRENISVRN